MFMGRGVRHVLAFTTMSACLMAARPCTTSVSKEKFISSPNIPKTALTDSWGSIHCSFEKGLLTYSGEKKVTIKLDSKLKNPTELICSGDFSVLISGNNAIIALGADDVLENDSRMMRIPFAPFNSYILRNLTGSSAAVAKATVQGDRLTIETDGGEGWQKRLSDEGAWQQVY
jgi:hypothetical protein